MGSPCTGAGGLSSALPMIGPKTTATSHDAISAIATTENSEDSTSLAPPGAKPTGTKLAMVTSVPISIGAASVR